MTKTVRVHLFFILFLTSCFKNVEEASRLSAVDTSVPKITTTAVLNPSGSTVVAKEKLLTKPQRESIYFAASLEKEALKLLLKNPSFDELTLFSVLSYAVEADSGIKKMAPARLDCSRFRLKPDRVSRREIKVFKTCQKPEVLIATIDLGLTALKEQNQHTLKITFNIKEWAHVVGLSVLLMAKDPVCDITIEDKKLQRLQCENWHRSVAVTNSSAEEIRLKTFLFERKQKNQFVLKGGRYKDLMERIQFNIEVPLEGKIVRWEKEIEVIDEFADKLEPTAAPSVPMAASVPAQRLQINGEKNGGKTKDNEENQIGGQDGENGGIPPQPESQQQRPAGGR